MSKRVLEGMAIGAASVAVAWWFLAAQPLHTRKSSTAPDALPADWILVKELPAVPDPDGGPSIPSERVTLKVENGWLVVRRDAGDQLQWSVVLSRADDPNPPAAAVVTETRHVDVQYGCYFIREMSGRLRVYRQKKTATDPVWPVVAGEPQETPCGSAWNVRMGKAGSWFWLTAGAVADRPDVRIRFQHAALEDPGRGFQGFPTGLAYLFCGDEAKCFDEGDLLTARRVPSYEAESVLRYRRLMAEFGTKAAPSLDGNEWFNAPSPITLEQFKGKVVLLDFWGKWCGPCVAKLPVVQELHEKFKDRGVVVIGVHSADEHEGLAEFLKAKRVSFPVVIDSGKTAARYLIGAWPTYFLIDRSGKVVSGFTSQPPTAERIEELLNAGM